jgi:hypothetical protein
VYGPGETGNDVIGADVEIGRLQNMSKKKKRQEAVCDIDQDGNFAFIAGYTPGGFPYGITWEEQAEIDRRERKGQLTDEGPDKSGLLFRSSKES